MGNPVSKLQSEKKLNVSVSNEDNEVTEQFKLDPRSPSAEISRTPVQLRSPKKRSQIKMTKQQNLNESLTTPTKVQTKGMLNSLLRGRLGPSLDLRSPSANIDRTPIVLDKKIASNAKIALEDVTDSFTSMTVEPKILLLDESVLDYSLVNNDDIDASEKLDEVAQDADDYINSKNEKDLSCDLKCDKLVLSASDKRKSYLETNVDCLETNLDEVKTLPKLKKASFSTPSSISESNKKLLDPRSPSGDFCRTPISQTSVKKMEYSTPVLDNKLTIVNALGDPRSVTREIFRTPISLPSNEDSLADSLTKVPSIIPEDLNKSPVDENILNLSIEIPTENKIASKATKLDEIRKDFAKKYGKNIKSDPVNQIYEDVEFHKVTPRKALSASSRTPLSCVRNKQPAHPRSKSENGQNAKVEVGLTTTNDLKAMRTPLSCVRNVKRQTKSENATPTKKMETQLTMINDLSNAVITKQTALTNSVKLPRGMSRIPTFQQKTVNNLAIDNLRSDIENSSSQVLKPDTWDKDSSVVI